MSKDKAVGSRHQASDQDQANTQSSTYVEVNQSIHQSSTAGPSTSSLRQNSGSSAGSNGQSDASEGSDVDLQSKVDELTEDLQRIQADFVNFRRRSDDERGEFLTLAKQDVIMQLLPV